MGDLPEPSTNISPKGLLEVNVPEIPLLVRTNEDDRDRCTMGNLMADRHLIGNSMANHRAVFVIAIASDPESEVLPIDGDRDRRLEGNVVPFF